MLSWFLLATSALFSPSDFSQAFKEHPGALVVIDCANGETFRSNANACAEKLPPCSTFKIWNTAIGLETGIITDADAPFWKWDGTKRSIEPWNADQTVRTAYQVSCVPAYQELARKIGQDRMAEWMQKIGYGDGNMASGLDVFWLPAEGRKSLLISPDEQAALMQDLVEGKTAFSGETLRVLKDVMQAEKTERGTLYGKTGTGTAPDGSSNLGWYVGYVESRGKTYAFAATVRGEKVMGKDARAAVEKIFREKKLL